MSPRVLLPLVLALGLGGCSMSNLGLFKIDVQQGNAIDESAVAQLQPGLSKTQVRFLMGTPLIADPFHPERWDYVYEMRHAGKLSEEKRVTLIFEGETLARIMDADPAAPLKPQAAQTQPPQALAAAQQAATLQAAPVQQAEPAPAVATPQPAPADPVEAAPLIPETTVVDRTDTPPADLVVASEPAPTAESPADTSTSVVAPLDAPAATEPAPPQTLPDDMLIVEDNADHIKSDPIPSFDQPTGASDTSGPTAAVNDWVNAWRSRNADAYLASYADDFAPQGGGSRADWEKRRRLLLGQAQNIDLRIENVRVDFTPDGEAQVNFDQYYRSDSYRDAVNKDVKLKQVDGRWLIVEERVLKVLRQGRAGQ